MSKFGLLTSPKKMRARAALAVHEVLDAVEVVAPVGVPGEVLAEVVLAEVEPEADLVVPGEEREALLDLELPFVHVDRQPPRLAERPERRLEDPEVRLHRAIGQVRQPVEVVVGVLDPELVDAGLAEQRDHRADEGVGALELPRLLGHVVRGPGVVGEVVAEGERVLVVHAVVQLAEQDQVVGLAHELAAGGAVAVRAESGQHLGIDRLDRVVLARPPDVPDEGLAACGLVVRQEEVGPVPADGTAEGGAPVVALELVHLIAVVGRVDAALGIQRRLGKARHHPLVAEEEEP